MVKWIRDKWDNSDIECKAISLLFIRFPIYPFILSPFPCSPLVPHQPAVDVKRLAGDVARFV